MNMTERIKCYRTDHQQKKIIKKNNQNTQLLFDQS